jgi:hypothetical protein
MLMSNRGKCTLVWVLWHQFLLQKNTCKMVETYIAATLSKPVNRTCHFSVGCIHASMNSSLKSKRNELGEVYFGLSFVASVFCRKAPAKWLKLT